MSVPTQGLMAHHGPLGGSAAAVHDAVGAVSGEPAGVGSPGIPGDSVERSVLLGVGFAAAATVAVVVLVHVALLVLVGPAA